MARNRNSELERLEESAEDVPSATEAQFDEGAAKAREAHAQSIEKIAMQEHGVPDTGGEAVRKPRLQTAPGNPHRHSEADLPNEANSPGIPDNRRIGLMPPLRAAFVPDEPEDVLPVEANEEMLKAIQDPYNERNPKSVPMVYTKDAYGNLVQMPV